MRNTSSGIFIVTSIDEGIVKKEVETFTCCHCGCIRMISKDPQKTQDGGFCFRCAKLICKAPACHSNCSPYKARPGIY